MSRFYRIILRRRRMMEVKRKVGQKAGAKEE